MHQDYYCHQGTDLISPIWQHVTDDEVTQAREKVQRKKTKTKKCVLARDLNKNWLPCQQVFLH